jgi:putative hydrolase of the HAD superfamily
LSWAVFQLVQLLNRKDVSGVASSGVISAVLFDLYGTLVDLEVDEQDPRVWEALAALFHRWGRSASPDDLKWRFRDLCSEEAERYGYGAILPSVFGQLISATGGHPTPAETLELADVFRRTSIEAISLRPYARDILSILRNRGIKVALVSNTESILSRFDIHALKIESLFETIVFSSDFRITKPNPEIFIVALRRLRTDVSEAIMVGDDWGADIAGARAAGLGGAILLEQRDESAVAMDGGYPTVVRAAPDLDAILAAMRLLGVAV